MPNRQSAHIISPVIEERIAKLGWERQWKGTDDVVVWIDVVKADRAWSRDGDYYIAAGAPKHRGKYEFFGEWLETAKVPIFMPHITWSAYVVTFTDGRHRFAWLRDAGVRSMPVTTGPDNEADKLRKWVGSKGSPAD